MWSAISCINLFYLTVESPAQIWPPWNFLTCSRTGLLTPFSVGPSHMPLLVPIHSLFSFIKERERNINVWLPLPCPQLGTWPQTRHVPRLGIEPVTLWFTSPHSIHWATGPIHSIFTEHLVHVKPHSRWRHSEQNNKKSAPLRNLFWWGETIKSVTEKDKYHII